MSDPMRKPLFQCRYHANGVEYGCLLKYFDKIHYSLFTFASFGLFTSLSFFDILISRGSMRKYELK